MIEGTALCVLSMSCFNYLCWAILHDCFLVFQPLISSTLSFGGAALCVQIALLCSLPSLGSATLPKCTVAANSLCIDLQGFTRSVFSLGRVAPHVHAAVPPYLCTFSDGTVLCAGTTAHLPAPYSF